MAERLEPMPLPAGYGLRQGSGLDRALLLKLMQRTYGELHPGTPTGYLAETVDRYLSGETPLWFVEAQPGKTDPPKGVQPETVACIWSGMAIDPVQGDRHAHIFLLYVAPAHRRQGIALALLQRVEMAARARGDRQIALQVFESNTPAVQLYEKLGFQVQSLLMTKTL